MWMNEDEKRNDFKKDKEWIKKRIFWKWMRKEFEENGIRKESMVDGDEGREKFSIGNIGLDELKSGKVEKEIGNVLIENLDIKDNEIIMNKEIFKLIE